MNDAKVLLAGSDPLDQTIHPDETVNRVLSSRTFEKTPALRALLLYLWRNQHTAISEYAIATEALGRPPYFDAKTDATVRVQISRLRQRLEKFYKTEGQHCRERIGIPLGSHQMQIELMTSCGDEIVAGPLVTGIVANQQSGTERRVWMLAVAVVLLSISCITEAVFWRNAEQFAKRNEPTQAPWLWKSFFANGLSARIILPTPTFFTFHRPGGDGTSTLMFRDTEVNDFNGRNGSASYRILEREFGHSWLAENYTVTSDTFAAVSLARYLDNFKQSIAVASSADAPLEALDKENMIAVGTWGTLAPLRPYLDHMTFQLGPHETYVKLRNRQPDEPERINSAMESADRGVWPGVIAFLPGSNRHTHLLILASRYTSALVSFLTSTNGLDQLEHLWKAKGSPEYFEVVVNAELSGRGLVRFWPVALHPYKNKA